MISLFNLTHRFKRSMLEIASSASSDLLWKIIDPRQKGKLPSNITFKVVAGKKAYDIIRLHQDIERFYSQKIIDILSQFVDMTDKCYPIKIEGIDEKYYVIHNLKTYPYLNRDEKLFMYDPRYYEIVDPSIPIFGIENTAFVMVSKDVKNALLKNKVTNIELVEEFGCSKEEYEMIKKSKFVPEVHVYRDK